jgi:hypothetical protein
MTGSAASPETMTTTLEYGFWARDACRTKSLSEWTAPDLPVFPYGVLENNLSQLLGRKVFEEPEISVAAFVQIGEIANYKARHATIRNQAHFEFDASYESILGNLKS